MTDTVAVPGMNHPTEETLAAFTDRTLSDAERQEVIKHMAECAECLDVVLLSTEIADTEPPAVAAASAMVLARETAGVEASAANAVSVVRPRFRWKRIVPLAAAASIAVLVAVPFFRPDPMGKVLETVKTVEERPNAARLDLDIPYKRARATNRGGVKVGSIYTEIAASEAVERAVANPTVGNLHAAGVAYVYDGKYAKAVEMLERADTTDRTPSVALLNNLTAAYLSDGRYEDALKTAERSLAIEQTPAAAWNRALALKWSQRDVEARAAWQQYLKIDPDSEWAAEIRREHLTDY